MKEKAGSLQLGNVLEGPKNGNEWQSHVTPPHAVTTHTCVLLCCWSFDCMAPGPDCFFMLLLLLRLHPAPAW